MKFSGIVKKHLGRGTVLGFPTANIDAPAESEDGIFLGWAFTNPLTRLAKKFPALIFIGSNPTFNESFRRAEIYILDFSENLYNKQLEVEILKKLRDVEKFDSPTELIAQMKKDEVTARDFFKDL